ncbi:hypothetical protein EDD80_11347 [Anseongella ginsenosidimutans]|uniref:HEPN domain-containing protein n=1 Tax=Anseongella ginsenosidimutans TaxID=496056 RepID=A0A4R3KN34_9SPHI|nr:hypothetical protein [Anseongella ginsenosidimutans]TCS85310.1 hypothetical protein EDD80_11347 [Anseongella ginsenosidimutans]
MSKKKIHGERNAQLSASLTEGQVYYDWAVTTAFYAAIHFVEDKVLPCELNGKDCKNIGEVRKAYNTRGRHEARERLVGDHLAGVASQYKWLDDRSRYSRYVTYKVSSAEASKANQYVREIFEYCYSQ